MNDLISRQAAIDAIDRLDIPEDMCVFEILSHIELEIGTLPSAQPEIIMCADCKKYIDYRCRDEHANLSDWRHEDDYCSYGKRREVRE